MEWMKFFFNLWLDSEIREQLDPAQRGVFVDLMCLVWRYQFSANGASPSIPLTVAAIARICGVSVAELKDILAVFEHYGLIELAGSDEQAHITVVHTAPFSPRVTRQTRWDFKHPDETRARKEAYRQRRQGRQMTTGTTNDDGDAIDRDIELDIDNNRDTIYPTPPPPTPNGREVIDNKSVDRQTDATARAGAREVCPSPLILSLTQLLNDNYINVGRSVDLAKQLRALLTKHSPDDITVAIREACSQNHLTWNYVKGILRNWEKEGRSR